MQVISGSMKYLFLLLVLVLECLHTNAAWDKDLYCSACRVIIDETQYAIRQVDPKKKIQVGSFRVDPEGNQATYERPYARSEVFLTETFEELCGKLNEYAQTTDKDSKKKKFTRTNSRNGEMLQHSNIMIGGDTVKELKNMCYSLLEEYEEDFITLFSQEKLDIEKIACVEIADVCTEEDLVMSLVDHMKESDVDDANESADKQAEEKTRIEL